jgi:hypothetical protein
MSMSWLLRLLGWLASRARAGMSADSGNSPWSEAGTADRAGQLVPMPDDGLEPEVGRAFGLWWLWLAAGVILLMLAAGYFRRRLKARGKAQGVPLTSREQQ